MVNPIVSIVVTTKNEEQNIENCLKSIKWQTYSSEKIEIIVVDNNSSDKTKEISRKYTNKVFDKGPERSAQRNFGMTQIAKGEYLMYLDADMILSPTVIEKAVQKLQRSNLKNPVFSSQYSVFSVSPIALYIPEVILGNSYWSKVRRFERSFYDGTVIDCVRIVRKDVFIKVGAFDLSMTGPEDWDLDKKIRNTGKTELLCKYNFEEINTKIQNSEYPPAPMLRRAGKILNTKEPIIFHNEADFNLSRYLAKKKYYIKSFDTYVKKWDKNDPDIRKQFGFWYRYFGVFIENGKWKRFLRYPVLVTGVFLLRFLVGVSFVINFSIREMSRKGWR